MVRALPIWMATQLLGQLEGGGVGRDASSGDAPFRNEADQVHGARS